MKFHPSNPIKVTLLTIVLILSFSCNKDSDLLAEFVVEKPQGILVNDIVVTQANQPIVIKPQVDETFEKPENITVTGTTPPKLGNTVVNGDNTITYTPDSNKTGTDEFDYTANITNPDNSITTETGKVTVTITEKIPTTDEIDYGKLKAFPSAFGAGAQSIGGRGGTIIHVTNLNDSGKGSFREAILTPGARTIVFDVSGNINLNSELKISGSNLSNVTIAGQTAPKGGITFTGNRIVWGNVNNVIVRYIRFRGFRMSGGVPVEKDVVSHEGGNNIIYDHCSLSFGGDECISFTATTTGRIENVTLQRSLMGNSKTGSIMGSSDYPAMTGDFSSILNLWADINHRHPNFGGNSRFDNINNVVFNWVARTSVFNNGDSKVNLINNYNKEGTIIITNPNHLDMYYKIQNPAKQKVYAAGNIRQTNAGSHRPKPDALYGFNSPSKEMGSPYAVNTPFMAIDPTYTILSASDAYTNVLSDVGANKYLDDNGNVNTYQDSFDIKKINNVINGTPGVLVQYGGYSEWIVPAIPNNSRPKDYDTDKDGIPNAWEIVNGLDPNNPNDAQKDRNGDGYTNLEDFLNQVDF